MKNLSIVIITKNEERNIEKCLISIIDISNDIIIIDSGSNDNTKKICEKYGVKFIFNPFKDYSSQKNFGNSIALHDYILSIDADEQLSKELKDAITDLDLDNNKNIAYSFNRLNFHCGKPIKHCGWYPDKKTRIWNKRYGKWKGTIHEKIIFKAQPSFIHLKGDLLHYTYHSKKEHIEQAMKFSSLNAQKDFKEGKKSNHIFAFVKFIIRFISIYFFKLGFLDGSNGFFIAKISAIASFNRKKQLIKLMKI